MAQNEKLHRTANFAPGPAVLPEEVLLECQKELLDYHGLGYGVMEMSHRSKEFDDIWNGAVKDIKELLNIPDNYQIFFLQGGATTQFSSIPLNFNLTNNGKVADYVVTGNWSNAAYKEAQRFGKVNLVVNTMSDKPEATRIPPLDEWKLSDDACYLHLCVNETVHGVTMREFPQVKCPIVADFSSCFMSEPIDVKKFDVIYAGAQKNIGPAGVTVVIVKNDILGNADPKTPILMDWQTHVKDIMLNTPPCFAVYVMALIFKWLKKRGGLEKVKEYNEKKAKLIYDVIEEDDFYICPVDKPVRSIMNLRFFCKQGADMDNKFVKEAAKLELLNLKGYRTIGGIRASLYNAQTIENCEKLAKFMREFRKSNQNKTAKM